MTTPFEIFRIPLVAYRKLPGSYVNGRWVEGGETSFTITASVQPSNGDEMQMVPEGRRNRKVYTLYTSYLINTVTDTNPDQLVIYGDRYEVIRVENWHNNPSVFFPVNHYKFIAMALEAIE